MKHHLINLFVGIFLFISCTQDEILNHAVEQPVATRSVEETAQVDDYKVNNQLLQKYLKSIKKDTDVKSITPLIREGNTLAYAVQYSQGWDVVSGDKRLPPVMVKSEVDTFDINTSGVLPLLNYIENFQSNATGEILKVWSVLEPKQTSYAMSRSLNDKMTVGMWRPVIESEGDAGDEDAGYSFDTDYTDTGHLIKTTWWQRAPWDEFTPYINGKTPVGCEAVAIGQIIYFFRENNPREVTFPSNSYLSMTTGLPVFEANTNDWSLIAKVSSDYDKISKTAAFLSYLGSTHIMDLTCTTAATSGGIPNMIVGLDSFKIDTDILNGYSYSTIVSNIYRGLPVGVVSMLKNSTSRHAYIIDRIMTATERRYKQYYWDPDYVVSEEEFYRNPAEMFEEPSEDPNKGTIYKEIDESYVEMVYFGMNWGLFNGTSNNNLYLAKYDTYGGQTTYLDPYWQYGSTSEGVGVETTSTVTTLFHNLREKEEKKEE